MYIYIGVECMDSLQKAVIHAPEPCEACFILDAHTLFDVLWLLNLEEPGQLINSDWSCLKEESHIHLGCL